MTNDDGSATFRVTFSNASANNLYVTVRSVYTSEREEFNNTIYSIHNLANLPHGMLEVSYTSNQLLENDTFTFELQSSHAEYRVLSRIL